MPPPRPPAGTTVTVPVRDLLFTQDSIGAEFTKSPLPDWGVFALATMLARVRKSNGYPSELGPLEAVEVDGLLYSCDNRRLCALKEAEVRGGNVSPAPVKIVERCRHKITCKGPKQCSKIRVRKQFNEDGTPVVCPTRLNRRLSEPKVPEWTPPSPIKRKRMASPPPLSYMRPKSKHAAAAPLSPYMRPRSKRAAAPPSPPPSPGLFFSSTPLSSSSSMSSSDW